MNRKVCEIYAVLYNCNKIFKFYTHFHFKYDGISNNGNFKVRDFYMHMIC